MRITGKQRNKWSGRKGIFLIELLVVVALMGVGATLAGELIMMTLRIQREAPVRQTRMNRMDQVMDRLRRDVWSATAIRATSDGDRVELQQAEESVAWQAGGDGTLMCTVAGEVRKWVEMPKFGFGVNGGTEGALLKVMVDSGGTKDEATMASARILVVRGGL